MANQNMSGLREALTSTSYIGMDNVKLGLALGLVSGEHVYLCSHEPGNAKSDVAVETLSQIATEDEMVVISGVRGGGDEQIVGYLSPAGLRHDQYRMVPGKTAANVPYVFVDEVDKMSCLGQEALLQIMAQKRFSRAGIDIACPLKLLVGAGNEPARSQPLRDRFAVEVPLKLSIPERHSLTRWTIERRRAHGHTGVLRSQADNRDLLDEARHMASHVDLTTEAETLLGDLSLAYGISPRRQTKFVALVQAAAVLFDRECVDSDLVVLVAPFVCLVNGDLTPETRDAATKTLHEKVEAAKQARALADLQARARSVETQVQGVTGVRSAIAALKALRALVQDIDLDKIPQNSRAQFEELLRWAASRESRLIAAILGE